MVPCRFLEWDSEFFGCRIARVEAPLATKDTLESALHWAVAERIDCLYLLARSDSPETISAVEAEQFGLKDIRITYKRSATPFSGQLPAREKGIFVRTFCPTDLETLSALARTAHRDTRFFSDLRFDREKAASLYEVWLRKACSEVAGRVFVGEIDGTVGGYLTCSVDSAQRGSIGLVAVSLAHRRVGLGGRLVEAALLWFRDQRATEVSVVTQGRNVAAQRLYQAAVFHTHAVELWYHKWLSSPH